jgi:hypothetical protein
LGKRRSRRSDNLSLEYQYLVVRTLIISHLATIIGEEEREVGEIMTIGPYGISSL